MVRLKVLVLFFFSVSSFFKISVACPIVSCPVPSCPVCPVPHQADYDVPGDGTEGGRGVGVGRRGRETVYMRARVPVCLRAYLLLKCMSGCFWIREPLYIHSIAFEIEKGGGNGSRFPAGGARDNKRYALGNVGGRRLPHRVPCWGARRRRMDGWMDVRLDKLVAWVWSTGRLVTNLFSWAEAS